MFWLYRALSAVLVLHAGIKLLLLLQEVMVQPCHAILKNATLVQVRLLHIAVLPVCYGLCFVYAGLVDMPDAAAPATSSR
jgi:hypothetical protein